MPVPSCSGLSLFASGKAISGLVESALVSVVPPVWLPLAWGKSMGVLCPAPGSCRMEQGETRERCLSLSQAKVGPRKAN